MDVNKNDSHHRKSTCTFLHIQKSKIVAKRLYIYTKSLTISVPFLFTRSQTLYVTRFFMKCLKLAFIFIQIVRQFALQDVLNKKGLTLQKQHDSLRYVLKLKRPDSLLNAVFHRILKLAEGGGIFILKMMYFALNFYMKKKLHFPLHLFIQKARHFASCF